MYPLSIRDEVTPKATYELVIPDYPSMPEGTFVTIIEGERTLRGVVKFSDPDGYMYIEECTSEEG